jgi:hypothetical protein
LHNRVFELPRLTLRYESSKTKPEAVVEKETKEANKAPMAEKLIRVLEDSQKTCANKRELEARVEKR